MSSMKGQITEVIQEVNDDSQRSKTSRESPRGSPRGPIDDSMIQQDNKFDVEVVGEIE